MTPITLLDNVSYHVVSVTEVGKFGWLLVEIRRNSGSGGAGPFWQFDGNGSGAGDRFLTEMWLNQHCKNKFVLGPHHVAFLSEEDAQLFRLAVPPKTN